MKIVSCQRCGSGLAAGHDLCIVCRSTDSGEQPAEGPLPNSDLRRLLEGYRHAKGYDQQTLADELGCSQPQVARLLNGTRPFTSSTLKVVAGLLGLSYGEVGLLSMPLVLDTQILAALTGSVRKAGTLRNLGRPIDAADLLWPTLEVLERHHLADDSNIEVSFAVLEARLVNCRIVGDLAYHSNRHQGLIWARRAIKIGWLFKGTTSELHASIQFGNQLRIAGQTGNALKVFENVRLRTGSSHDGAMTAAGSARAAAEAGQASEFSYYISQAHDLLSKSNDDALVNRLSFGEIEARGRLELGLPLRELPILGPDSVVAPQWGVIAKLTRAEMLVGDGSPAEGLALVSEATREAQRIWLPRQIERAIGIAGKTRTSEGLEMVHLLSSTLQSDGLPGDQSIVS